MCHFTAHVASCTGTHVPAGAVPARVHAQHWCVPRVAQSHLRACSRIPCVSTGDAQAASLHKQGQPTRMHACCIMGISLHALVTVSPARGDALPSLPVAVVGMLLSHPRGGVAVGPHCMLSEVSSGVLLSISYLLHHLPSLPCCPTCSIRDSPQHPAVPTSVPCMEAGLTQPLPLTGQVEQSR